MTLVLTDDDVTAHGNPRYGDNGVAEEHERLGLPGHIDLLLQPVEVGRCVDAMAGCGSVYVGHANGFIFCYPGGGTPAARLVATEK